MGHSLSLPLTDLHHPPEVPGSVLYPDGNGMSPLWHKLAGPACSPPGS